VHLGCNFFPFLHPPLPFLHPQFAITNWYELCFRDAIFVTTGRSFAVWTHHLFFLRLLFILLFFLPSESGDGVGLLMGHSPVATTFYFGNDLNSDTGGHRVRLTGNRALCSHVLKKDASLFSMPCYLCGMYLRQLHMISPPMEKPIMWNLGPSCRLSANAELLCHLLHRISDHNMTIASCQGSRLFSL
jgi:hypothetical protein